MQNLVKVFKALGDRNRIRIIKMLQEKPMSVNELTAVLGISQPSVSRHLHLLKGAGLVEDKRDALWVNYRLSAATANEYVPILLKHITRWANQDSMVSQDHKKMKKVDRRKIKKE
ncbi:MAG: metalloregulator ArsR/SmtB family transcription factor [Candidatus Edwardsbacteria bacterium]|nr:metalloregulator ArsR/SmtB family transcription factor [Candidatus Edwardsbacteria bacterium]